MGIHLFVIILFKATGNLMLEISLQGRDSFICFVGRGAVTRLNARNKCCCLLQQVRLKKFLMLAKCFADLSTNLCCIKVHIFIIRSIKGHVSLMSSHFLFIESRWHQEYADCLPCKMVRHHPHLKKSGFPENDTKLHPVVRLQFRSSEECGCYFSNAVITWSIMTWTVITY